MRFALTLFLVAGNLCVAYAGDEKVEMMNRDPAVAQAIAASNAEVAAILADNAGDFGESIAHDAVINSPQNRINHRDDTLAVFRKGLIRYSAFDRSIEYAGRLGEFVLIMGEEVLLPKDGAPNSGKTVHRRFSDVWQNDAGKWRLAARQATIYKVE